MHWSNPPHLIPMIEVVPGEQTAAATTDKIVKIIESFGYEAVTEKEVPGFVENRILYAILRECLSLVERGIVSEADMDTCVKWGIGYKLAVLGRQRAVRRRHRGPGRRPGGLRCPGRRLRRAGRGWLRAASRGRGFPRLPAPSGRRLRPPGPR
jgi:hypothetical protein